MKKYFVWIVILYPFIAACGQSSKKTMPEKPTFVSESIDTNYLKNVKWHQLTSFVDFYILNKNLKTNTLSNKRYKIVLKGIFHYDTKEYDFVKDSVIFCGYNDLKNLMLNDSLLKYEDIDFLLKINSEIAYEQQPQLLKTIFLKPKELDNTTMQVLINKVKSKSFVDKVTLSTNDSLNESTSSTLLNIAIKGPANLKEVNTFCEKLRNLPNVDEVFIADFFTGENKQDLFYRVTSVR